MLDAHRLSDPKVENLYYINVIGMNRPGSDLWTPIHSCRYVRRQMGQGTAPWVDQVECHRGSSSTERTRITGSRRRPFAAGPKSSSWCKSIWADFCLAEAVGFDCRTGQDFKCREVQAVIEGLRYCWRGG